MRSRRLTLAALAVTLGLSACSGPVAAPTPTVPASASPAHHHQHSAGPPPSGAPQGTVIVHAADPLRDTLTKLIPKFEEAFPGAEVTVDYGAGLEHAQHILHGMPIDVFLSADEAATGMVTAAHDRGTPAVIARNPIVIALPPAGDRIRAIGDLRDARVALCADSTPCGRGSRAALEAAAVEVRRPTVEPDAPTALAQVTSGAVDAALTYRTDVITAGGNLRAVDFEQATGLADVYTAVRPTTGANPVAADAFVTFLNSSLARHIFADAGLSPA
ncbi:molybdate ABC transporter substrate-binding protein [Paractinoplanes lichenicola]|uniref:Substrate-binding domain-containing protein n=1 Tax=Paractinoplanes lichenicola TaxID=2802976 RepID=A0ABS1VZD2_9ACTN|nr:substrate-binding domain-containing protein [Actinoplanes lichenicola]MBL7259809.1 substrate-binding domain-containing protein [Actinoplanes lichenicola]